MKRLKEKKNQEAAEKQELGLNSIRNDIEYFEEKSYKQRENHMYIYLDISE